MTIVKYEPSVYKDHQDRRSRASKWRAILKPHVHRPIPWQIKLLCGRGVKEKDLADVLELKVEDINVVKRGTVYPYVAASWRRILTDNNL